MKISKPTAAEYASFYETYVSLVTGDDVIETLRGQLRETSALIGDIPEERGSFRYAAGKWSVKELIGHVIDGERVFGYRALRFARGDQTPLPGFDQDVFMAHSAFGEYSIAELAREYEQVRGGHLSMFEHFAAEAWSRTGVASENPVSVRALAYVMAGHEQHHMNILRDRYLTAARGEA